MRSPMSSWRFVVGALVLAGTAAAVGSAAPIQEQLLPASDPASPFIVEPYLQLGDVPKLAPYEPVRVLWQAPNEPGARWSVDVRQAEGDPWRPAVGAGGRVITQMKTQFRLFNVHLTRLRPGAEFEYRVSKDGVVVFSATGKTRSAADQPYRFVVTGDTGADTPQERRIVDQIARVQPDFLAIAGDLVYSTGRMSEYRQKYFPIYNAPVASPETGAPLIRSRLSFGAVGNHDAGSGDLERDPDGQAFYLNWALPLNGPYQQADSPNTQIIKGSPEAVRLHIAAIRSTFPRMANYSFDYGNSHWTFLDSNTYVDWSDAYLRNWLARDLAAAADATWKFIVFHHPPFNSSRSHFNEQQMRLITDIAEHRGVDIVFAGHVHNYQRTRPLKFLARPTADRTFKRAGTNAIDGDFQFDQSFDGVKETTPDGVLYIVTGAGGAGAYDPDQTDNQPTWQPFTTKMVSDVYSFTMVDVDGRRLTMKQISEHGEELDRIVVTKPSRVGSSPAASR